MANPFSKDTKDKDTKDKDEKDKEEPKIDLTDTIGESAEDKAQRAIKEITERLTGPVKPDKEKK